MGSTSGVMELQQVLGDGLVGLVGLGGGGLGHGDRLDDRERDGVLGGLVGGDERRLTDSGMRLDSVLVALVGQHDGLGDGERGLDALVGAVNRSREVWRAERIAYVNLSSSARAPFGDDTESLEDLESWRFKRPLETFEVFVFY